MRLKSVSVALILMVAPTIGFAQTCLGVEARVNARTTTLTTAVTGTIAAATTAYSAQQIAERSLIISSLRVLAEQNDVSLDQEVSATEAGSKALAQTIVEESVTSQIADAAESFGHTGYGACDLIVDGVAYRDARNSAPDVSADIHDAVMGRYGIQTSAQHDTEVQEWSALAISGPDVTAFDVFEGDEVAAQQFSRLVLGPPSAPVAGGGTATGIGNILLMQETARRSVVAKIIGDIAADQAITEGMASITDTWIGDDGGLEWAASLAASPPRAALLDLARIEAANVVLSAMEVRKNYREEFALSTFALTYIDTAVNDDFIFGDDQ